MVLRMITMKRTTLVVLIALALCPVLSFQISVSDCLRQNDVASTYREFDLGFATPLSIMSRNVAYRSNQNKCGLDRSSWTDIIGSKKVASYSRKTSILQLKMAGNRKDYYAILGVDRKADDKEIKRAYKRLAMRNHPDVNKDPGAKVSSTVRDSSLRDI
jgi:hypothetical protein